MQVKDVQKWLSESAPSVNAREITLEQIVFEERTKISCFYCEKYGNNFKCPPKLPEADFYKVLSEFERCCLVWSSFQIPSQGLEPLSEIRRDSSLLIHKTLLGIEKYLWENGGYNVLSFIGGSCKLCKNGCPADKCANPHQARIPLEAIGVNVVKTAENIGVKIIFPPAETLTRVGFIAW